MTSLIGYLSSIKMTFCGFLQIVLERNFPKNLKTKPTIQKNVNGTFRRDIILIGSRLRFVSFGFPVSYQCHIHRKLSFNQKVFKIVYLSSKSIEQGSVGRPAITRPRLAEHFKIRTFLQKIVDRFRS